MSRRHIFLPETLSEKLKRLAEQEGISISELIRRMLADSLRRMHQQPEIIDPAE